MKETKDRKRDRGASQKLGDERWERLDRWKGIHNRSGDENRRDGGQVRIKTGI